MKGNVMDLRKTDIEWNGFRGVEFRFEDRHCLLIFPSTPCEGNKWLLKTEYFNAFPAFEIEMLKRGFHLAYIANKSRWMVPEDVDVKDRFAQLLADEFGLNEKCVPVGMSCGGLHAVYFAAKYPSRIAALYLDAPVMNLLSCPGAVGRAPNAAMAELERDTGLNFAKLINYRNHPIDHVSELLSAKLPIILIAGDSDVVVPYNENGELLAKMYREGGGELVEIIKPGCNHHPHGLDDNTPIIDFVLNHY